MVLPISTPFQSRLAVFFATAAIVSLVFVVPVQIAHADSTAPHSDWGYGPSNGPSHWADLNPEYSLCRDGKLQSPVNFESRLDAIAGCPSTANDTSANVLHVRVTMPPMTAVNVSNLGHTVRWTPTDRVNRTMEVGGVMYSLVQFHVHTPSEHHVDNVFYDAEMHFYHASASGHTAVLAYLIEATDTNNTAFQVVLDEVPREDGETETYKDRFDATHVLVDLLVNGGYYTYNGSMTSPPCQESVRWIVAAAPLQLGRLQIRQLSRTLGFSARPPQHNEDLISHRRHTMSETPLNVCPKASSALSLTRATATGMAAYGLGLAAVWWMVSWL